MSLTRLENKKKNMTPAVCGTNNRSCVELVLKMTNSIPKRLGMFFSKQIAPLSLAGTCNYKNVNNPDQPMIMSIAVGKSTKTSLVFQFHWCLHKANHFLEPHFASIRFSNNFKRGFAKGLVVQKNAGSHHVKSSAFSKNVRFSREPKISHQNPC